MNKKSIVSLIISSFILIGIIILLLIVPKRINNNDKVLEESINKVYSSVVLVNGYSYDSLVTHGTGFFYKKDNKYAYILTNEHVITNTNDIRIVLDDNKEIKTKLLGKDEYLDIAVLRINKKYAPNILKLNNRKIYHKSTIFTIGFPNEKTVTKGSITKLNKMVNTTVKDEDYPVRVIEISSKLSPGNSGGPLLNINGEVIGICSMKLDNDKGLAIPIYYLIRYIEDLEKENKIKSPTLGIKITNADDTNEILRNNININNTRDEGIIVLENKKHLKKGDIITKINNIEIKNLTYLKSELYRYKPKETIKVTYIRNNKIKNTRLVLD